ncbi:NAD-binding Rossmann fold oxidoreductase [Cryptococcus wingfieldii CBS 7118]|uniref:NAD-binding Rossmann fold oxidoreductase n=1 Tax=Cryptococcus wingfieldii CBS 7118 TaxID=1295528 RepID=A0A1E3IVX1_9TREE|nr:NAD-binding Rossmann fold oxidoreductase [Cryptococcus wingfieldii CBS 7118]ODN92763.1 NAD-binding Rossmann fold oxidoreductase [Cryptococcus wingfieldii CBS 7118]
MPANVALLGSGVFAQASYLPALINLSKSNTLNLHTIWSRSESSAQTLHSKYTPPQGSSAPALQYGDDGLAAVLADDEIDAVLFVLPITKQPDLVRRAWKAGKHVLSEKPLGRDVREAKELVAEYERVYKPKDLIWRVAENYAHEPVLRWAADLLKSTPEAGPILYWDLKFIAFVEDGSKYHATSWRTIPDYQGGFLLDGGVHWTAFLRTVLPPAARPASVVAFSSLHRAFLLPHDTIQAIALPAPSSTIPPNGPKTKLSSADITESEVPTQPGQSTPRGQVTMSFAKPDLPPSAQTPNGLYITLLNGFFSIESSLTREWVAKFVPAQGSGLEAKEKRSQMEGVEVEIGMFAKAVAAQKEGKESGEQNFGEPRGALWDLGMLEAMLNSNGAETKIEQ